MQSARPCRSDSKVSLGENCCELQEIKKFLQYQPTSQSQSVVSQHPPHSEVRPEWFLKSNFQPYKGSHRVLKPHWLLCFVNFELITKPLSLLPRVWLSPRPHQSEPWKSNEKCQNTFCMWKCDKTQIVTNLRKDRLSRMGGGGVPLCSWASSLLGLCTCPGIKRKQQGSPTLLWAYCSLSLRKRHREYLLHKIPSSSCPKCQARTLAMWHLPSRRHVPEVSLFPQNDVGLCLCSHVA